MTSLKFEVFGLKVLVLKVECGWKTFYLGTEGKRRPAIDIVVPANITESEIEQYLDDLCHEWASKRYPNVIRLD